MWLVRNEQHRSANIYRSSGLPWDIATSRRYHIFDGLLTWNFHEVSVNQSAYGHQNDRPFGLIICWELQQNHIDPPKS